MRRDPALLLDMLLSARNVLRFTAGMSREDFLGNDLVQSAVVRELQVIGEAARGVSPEKKASLPDIDWVAITGMRNRLVHEYFRVDLDLLWQAFQTDIPPLIRVLEAAVSSQDDTP